MVQRFYKNKMYVGIIKARKQTYASCNAVLDGRQEIFTVHGKPYSIYHADEWIELPDSLEDKVKVFKSLIGNKKIRETSRVVECTNLLDAFKRGSDLITM